MITPYEIDSELKIFFSTSKNVNSVLPPPISKIIPLFIVCLVIIYFIFFKDVTNFNLKENSFLVSALILFALGWSLIKNKATFKENLVPLIIGPYLLTSLLLQSGLFTDRSKPNISPFTTCDIGFKAHLRVSTKVVFPLFPL